MKFNAAANLNQQFDTACTRHLRRQVEARLENAQIKLSSAAVFHNAATKHKKSDDIVSLVGCMLMIGAIFHGAEQMLCDHLGIDGNILPEGIIAGAAEFAVELRDISTENTKFKNKVEGYPEGRRQGLFNAPKPAKSFNLVCHNDHDQFDMDSEHEVRTLSDLLTALSAIENKGTTELKIAEGQTVKQALYAAMRQPTARVNKDFFKSLSLAA